MSTSPASFSPSSGKKDETRSSTTEAAPEISREEFRKVLIDLLEEDRELRYTLMGLLGFKEILDRITRIEERIIKLEER